MKSLISCLVLLFVLNGPTMAAKGGARDKTSKEIPRPTEAKQLPLIPTEQVWLYGFIPKDAWVGHHFTLHNPHDDTLTITELVPGCDCTHVPRAPIAIAPGETYFLKSQFDTRTYSGEISRDIHIVTDYKPNPEMDLFFISITATQPNSISVSPKSTLFINGKNSQIFNLKNLTDKPTDIKVLIDHDSSLTVSESHLSLDGNTGFQLTVKPIWDKIATGPQYSCLVLEVTREGEMFRMAVPIKFNKF